MKIKLEKIDSEIIYIGETIRTLKKKVDELEYKQLILQKEAIELKRRQFIKEKGITQCLTRGEKKKRIKKDKTPNELLSELKGWSDDKIDELKRLLEKNA